MINFSVGAHGGHYFAFHGEKLDGDRIDNAQEVRSNANAAKPLRTVRQCGTVYMLCPSCGLAYQTRARAKGCCNVRHDPKKTREYDSFQARITKAARAADKHLKKTKSR